MTARLPGLEYVGHDGQGDGGRFTVAAGTLTTQMISSAVCALRILAFLADAAWLAVTAKAPGRDGRLLP